MKEISKTRSKRSGKCPKKLTNKQIKLLFELSKHNDIYCAIEDLKLSIEVIEFWRKTNIEFNTKYLSALGITRSQERFLEVLPKKMLNISQTCRAVHIHRSTYYDWVDKSDTFRRFFHDVYEGVLDDVEAILFHKVFVEQDMKALDIYAKAKMFSRGYS